MKPLLPRYFRIVGLIMLPFFIILGLLCLFKDFEFEWLQWTTPFKAKTVEGASSVPLINNFTNELAGLGVIVSTFLIGFSKVKAEDEFIANLRLKALGRTFILYCVSTLVLLFAFYDFDFLLAISINAFVPLLAYIALFHFYLWQASNKLA